MYRKNSVNAKVAKLLDDMGVGDVKKVDEIRTPHDDPISISYFHVVVHRVANGRRFVVRKQPGGLALVFRME